MAAVVVGIAGVVAGGWWWSRSRPADVPAARGAADGTEATQEAAVKVVVQPEFERLKGRWLRPDGGYVLEIRSVEPGGKLSAGYFNPQPIHVARAAAVQDGAITRVFVELRDENYPGCTYTLAGERGGDVLTGIYYQAALGQQFEVTFVRMK